MDGPQDEHSAMIMGNTLGEWEHSYDLNYKRRESQEGVNAMVPWREAMLKSGNAALNVARHV